MSPFRGSASVHRCPRSRAFPQLGAVSIDHELIDHSRQSAMPDGVLVLKNGCICCSGETPGSELERVGALEKASLRDRQEVDPEVDNTYIQVDPLGALSRCLQVSIRNLNFAASPSYSF